MLVLYSTVYCGYLMHPTASHLTWNCAVWFINTFPSESFNHEPDHSLAMEGSQQFYGLTCNDGFGTGYKDMTQGVWCIWTMEITAILIIHFSFYSTVNCHYYRTARVTYTGQGHWFYNLWESYNLCLINKWWVHTTTHSLVSSRITVLLDRRVQLKIWNTSSLYDGFVT